jgi:hypothetical protein
MKSPPSQGRLTVFALLGLSAIVLVVATGAPAGAATDRPATPAPGRVTFGIEPASASGADGRASFTFGVTPGAVLFDHVSLLNYSSVPLTLQVYARDAEETTGGGFGLLPASSTSRGVGAWISGPPGDAAVEVPPETAKGQPGQTVVPFTVQVPANATPGDHVGGIIATLQTEGKNASGQQIILDQRVGTRVFVRVSGQISPRVTVSSVGAAYSGTANPFGQGTVDVHYVVTNAGNVDVGLSDQSISVSGLVADTHQARVAAVPLLLPGSSVSERVILPAVWPQFRLHATVTVNPVLLNGTSTQPLSPVTGSTSLWAIPWTLLLLIVVIVGLAWYIRRRRKAQRVVPSGPASKKVPVAA